jgi:hypothetical protein
VLIEKTVGSVGSISLLVPPLTEAAHRTKNGAPGRHSHARFRACCMRSQLVGRGVPCAVLHTAGRGRAGARGMPVGRDALPSAISSTRA